MGSYWWVRHISQWGSSLQTKTETKQLKSSNSTQSKAKKKRRCSQLIWTRIVSEFSPRYLLNQIPTPQAATPSISLKNSKKTSWNVPYGTSRTRMAVLTERWTHAFAKWWCELLHSTVDWHVYYNTELGDSLLFTQLLATHYLECQSKKFILLKCLIQKSKVSGLRGVDMYRYPRLPKTLGIWGSIWSYYIIFMDHNGSVFAEQKISRMNLRVIAHQPLLFWGWRRDDHFILLVIQSLSTTNTPQQPRCSIWISSFWPPQKRVFLKIWVVPVPAKPPHQEPTFGWFGVSCF